MCETHKSMCEAMKAAETQHHADVVKLHEKLLAAEAQRHADEAQRHADSEKLLASEGVNEAPTFMEWCTMVVPTYPEGGTQALQVCQHHATIRLCESATLSGCQRLKEHVARDCSGRFG